MNGNGDKRHAIPEFGSDSQNSTWVTDSGDGYHICNARHLFSFVVKRAQLVDVNIGKDSTTTAKYRGVINIVTNSECGAFSVSLQKVPYIPLSGVSLV